MSDHRALDLEVLKQAILQNGSQCREAMTAALTARIVPMSKEKFGS